MDAAAVAYQQVLAAWIAAGAAVVQAIGAIAAIIVSIQLARSSARREREAEVSAARRLEAADQAQRERDAAADRAAEARIERAKTESHNGLIDRISSLGFLALDQCQQEFIKSRAKLAEVTGNVIGGAFKSERLNELRDALTLIKNETSDPLFLEQISMLQDAAKYEKIESLGGASFVSAIENKFEKISGCLGAIRGLRRASVGV